MSVYFWVDEFERCKIELTSNKVTDPNERPAVMGMTDLHPDIGTEAVKSP